MDKAKLALREKEPKSLHLVVLALDLRPPHSSWSHTELSWLTGKASLTSYGLWRWSCLLIKHQLAASLEKGPREVSKNLHKVTCHKTSADTLIKCSEPLTQTNSSSPRMSTGLARCLMVPVRTPVMWLEFPNY